MPTLGEKRAKAKEGPKGRRGQPSSVEEDGQEEKGRGERGDGAKGPGRERMVNLTYLNVSSRETKTTANP